VATTIGDVGEKELIRTLVRPLFNPQARPELAGDDCGTVWVRPDLGVLLSTDRVPWDLVSFSLGLIDIRGLGYYLAVLNISDVAAMGGRPAGLLLNLALPDSFPLDDLKKLLNGIQDASHEFDCPILGGDLSNSVEPSLCATVLGFSHGSRVLHRSGTGVDHRPFCSQTVGLTPTAFAYFREAKPRGLRLSPDEEELLVRQFRQPVARVRLGEHLARSPVHVACMDNTDGLAQSLLEISEAGSAGIILQEELLPLHDVTREVAAYLRTDPVELALRPGADFQLVGTYAGDELPDDSLVPLGRAGGPPGQLFLESAAGGMRPLEVQGWNYFAGRSQDLPLT
jgi:thiamine-monophosphate kinase